MDFETIILQDTLAINFLMKNPELIKFGFDTNEECPQKFLLRKVNAGPANAQNTSRKSYSLFPIAISRQVNCSSCQGTLKIKKCIDSTLFDDVFGKVDIKILTKYCKACKSTVYPGFQENQIEKTRLYDNDWDCYKIFVSTHCTVFSIDHLSDSRLSNKNAMLHFMAELRHIITNMVTRKRRAGAPCTTDVWLRGILSTFIWSSGDVIINLC